MRRIFLNSRFGLLAGLALMLLAGFANPAKANAGFYRDYIVINGQYYYTNANDGVNPPFTGIGNIGSFDRGTGVLRLGGEANTFNNNGDDVQSVQLFYRVYLQNTAPGPFTPLGLNYVRSGDDGSANNKRWENVTSNPSLLNSANSPGRYVLEIYFQGFATYNNSGGSGTFNIYDSNNSNNYRATFDVTGSVPVTWNGSTSDDWFQPLNWTPNNVPTFDTDATIPYLVTGSRPTVYPSPYIRFGTATVRTLRINGNNNAIGARTFLTGGELQVFGDFEDPNGGFSQTGGTFVLAGTTQTLNGGSFFEVRIQGGGTKILSNRLVILTSLTFTGAGGIISTRTDNSTDFGVDLGANGSIIGESETSYVLGYLLANRVVGVNTPNSSSFGNIGVDLTTTAAPGRTAVIRRTGFVYSGTGTSKSIRRSFTFQPDVPDNLNFSLVFHYLDAELNGISENDLALFRSVNNGIPFMQLYGSVTNSTFNTLTRNNISGTLAATFTLGDRLNPLPVTVTSFKAVAQGADALLTWTTAQEINSQGFEVQVSTDGEAFQKLGFVASEVPNSTSARTYQYRDVTAGKQGTRYYRLRQLDIDGKEGFFGPQAVTFGEKVAAVAQGFPNPFDAEINLALQTGAAGPVSVSIIDGLGRQVRTWQPELEAGASSLRLGNLESLPHGLYVVQVRYGNGQTQRLKLMKK